MESLIIKYSERTSTAIPEVYETVLKTIRERQGIFDSEVDIASFGKSKTDDVQAAIN